MIVRESPSPSKSNKNIAWPPKSPLDASQSSPSHKRRLETTRSRDSVSPSPSKRARFSQTTRSGGDEEDDEDEETLQLKLKAIEARLKLKKLQKAKREAVRSRSVSASNKDSDNGGTSVVTARTHVQVPLSPKRQAPIEVNAESPKRIQLGIDKGLKASDVSLRRSKDLKDSKSRLESRHIHGNRQRPISSPRTKAKSFSERIAEVRDHEADRQRIEEQRVEGQRRGFGINAKDSKPYPKQAGDLDEPNPKSDHDKAQQSQRAQLPSKKSTSDQLSDNDAEKFSNFRLSKQKLTHSTLSDALHDKELFSIHKLLRTVIAPDYDPPDVETDYVVFGIIASKSTPFEKATTHKTTSTADPSDKSDKPNQSKFMYLRLTDLEYEVNMFLFDSAFDAFWKLSVGTVVGILNPGIMPPKKQMRDSGAFSLKLGSSEDTVLEIGNSVDLAFCKSIKRDGQQCTQWLDKRKTEYCDFHINLKAEKTKASRMEINGMVGLSMFGPNDGGKSGRRGPRGRQNANQSDGKGKDKKTEGSYYDREAREVAYKVRGIGQSTAKLLDAEDYGPGGLDGAERSRLRMAAQQKERELANALASQGSGMGGEYMRLRKGDVNKLKQGGSSETQSPSQEPLDAVSMGLTNSSAAAVRLGPSKSGKLKGSALEGGMGWARAFKRGLLEDNRPAPKEQTDRTEKRARFALDKGIRIPGKESRENLLKTETNLKANSRPDNDDDDDGLDII